MILRHTYRQFLDACSQHARGTVAQAEFAEMLDTCDLTVAAPMKNSSEI